ncbi:MAG TPA: glycosyltransferase family 2 protein, partial [Anaerolineae bacterium]|nr:glycosyltransferase family 2 protein [Anaerolineae bacterium]
MGDGGCMPRPSADCCGAASAACGRFSIGPAATIGGLSCGRIRASLLFRGRLVIKPFCTTIIPTVGRDSLARAVESVLTQSLPDAAFEIVVVNDSGRPLPPADWQHIPCVRLLHTHCRERSVARNTGAAAAHGRYLHFLDDDDWLLPGALARFWQAAQAQTADWLYGGFQFVDGDGRILEDNPVDESGNVLVRLLAGEWLPLQASLIRSDAFWAAGGFDPALSMFED